MTISSFPTALTKVSLHLTPSSVDSYTCEPQISASDITERSIFLSYHSLFTVNFPLLKIRTFFNTPCFFVSSATFVISLSCKLPSSLNSYHDPWKSLRALRPHHWINFHLVRIPSMSTTITSLFHIRSQLPPLAQPTNLLVWALSLHRRVSLQ